jgi:hypothetical protein
VATLVEYFELVLKKCSRTYGSSPCTASVGVTGDFKCYNSPATCQDPANFAVDEQVIRFVKPSGDLPITIDAIPNIESIAVTPAKLAPGENCGVRSTLSVRFLNHRHNDVGIDPYLSDRGFNPYIKGTFWPRWVARWPNIKGFECRYVQGQVGQDIDDMTRDYFIVDRTDGPGSDGGYSINAKDALTCLDNDKAVIPELSPGSLLASITSSSGSFTLTPSGIGASYSGSGLASIDDESVTFTRSSDVITLTARGVNGSVAAAHEAGATFQEAVSMNAVDPTYIVNECIIRTPLPLAYYDYSVWLDETSTNIGRLYSGDIMKPTGVKKIVDECVQQFGLSIWADTRAKKLRIKVLRREPPLAVWDDDVFLPDSVQGSFAQDSRVSQLFVYYGQKNPLRKLDEEENYRGTLNIPYSDARTALEESPPAIRKLYARWIDVTNRAAAEWIGQVIVDRYGRAPRHINFSLPRTILPTLGSTVSIRSRVFEDAQGDMADYESYLITRVQNNLEDYAVQAEQVSLPLTAPSGDRYVYIDVTTVNIDLKALHDEVYLPATSGDTVIFIVSLSGLVGSSSTATFAMINDGWAAGVDVHLRFTGGRVQGRGGQGGYAQSALIGAGYSSAPSDGGPALYTRYPITIDDAVIWSGGGGGSTGSPTNNPGGTSESWGGGGAGYLLGYGGEYAGNGTATAGGIGGLLGTGTAGSNGGGPGLAATGGGSAGVAIDGVSYCTFTGTSDIRGAQIN